MISTVMVECIEPLQLSQALQNASEDLRILLELEVEVMADSDLTRIYELEPTIKAATQLYQLA